MAIREFVGKTIGVLMGGMSSEREISLNSGRAVAASLSRLGYHAIAIDADTEVASTLRAEGIGVAFIALHGRYGEDGVIQGLLEWMKIPYTGSGVLASALGMDKIASRGIFRSHRLPTPPCLVRTEKEASRTDDLPFDFPAVVKPASEGSSVGVAIVKDAEGMASALKEAFRYGPRVIVEQYIQGREIHVGILGDAPLGAIEIRPKTAFYDYTAKYAPGMSEHIFPAPLPSAVYQAVSQLAYQAHGLLGCVGVSRVDLLLDDEMNPYVLEVNTLPGMTETSLLPEMARGVGIDFDGLVEKILETALWVK